MAQTETNAGGGQSSSGCGCLFFFVIIVILLPIALYEPLDEAGWIHHSHDTPVWIQGDWMNGEYRDCEMLTGYNPPNKIFSSDNPNDYPRLFCGLRHNYELSNFVNSVRPEDMEQANDVVFYNSQKNQSAWKALNAYFHVLPVGYVGRISRSDKWTVSWHCQRNSESLKCKALD